MVTVCGLCGRKIKNGDVTDWIGNTEVHHYCKRTARWQAKGECPFNSKSCVLCRFNKPWGCEWRARHGNPSLKQATLGDRGVY